MAAKQTKPVTVGTTTYELVDAPDCGPQFVALVKTVQRSNGPKVKRLVFNREHIAAVKQAIG